MGSPSHSILQEYTEGEVIKGWINISFDNEPNSSLFKDSFGNSITLLELLNENSDFIYNTTDGNVSNSSFQRLYLDNGNFLTSGSGNHTYQLNLSNIEIFSENITILAEIEDVNATLQEKQEELEDIKNELEKLENFSKSSLTSALNIKNIEAELNNLTSAYENASTEEEYDEILSNLSKIEIPKNVSITTSADAITFYPQKSKINLYILESIGGGSYESGEEDKYKNSVLAWQQENIDATLTFKEFSANYEDSEIPVLRIFELGLNKKKDINYDSYIILSEIDSLEFKQDYNQIKIQDYLYIKFTENTKTIAFSTTENISFSELPLFLAPGLNELVLSDEIPDILVSEEETEKESKWLTFVLIIVLLLIIGFVLYLVLQTWYKKKYERYLFKNKNDLYNIVTYIHHAKEKNMDNKKIVDNLRKAGWSYEQIKYVMRKYVGKRTGMYEIPVGKILKKKNEKGNNLRRSPPK